MPAAQPQGETLHVIGEDGLHHAKRWLERTGRAEVSWVRNDLPHVPYLTFPKAVGQPFSFDLGGRLKGAPFAGDQFFAEVKRYSTAGRQKREYGEYLAKCYRATTVHQRPYHFMWVTWHPFALRDWKKLCTPAEVKASIESRKVQYLGTGAAVDEEVCKEIAERLWLIVLSDKQLELCLTDTMVAVLQAHEVTGHVV